MGLGGLDHNGSACVVRGSYLDVFLEAERVTRAKNQALDSPEVVEALVKELNVQHCDIDCIAIADRTWFNRSRVWLLPYLQAYFPKARVSVHHHHVCHAASAFYTSGLERAVFVTMDGKGDGLASMGGLASHTDGIRPSVAVPSAHSIGRLWWAASEFAGMSGHHSAGKTMALSASGEARYLAEMLQHVRFMPDGAFRFIPPSKYPDCFRRVPELVSWMERLTGVDRADVGPRHAAHMDIAATVQGLTEAVVTHTVSALVNANQERNVCLAGGVALNGLANQRLIREDLVGRLFIPPYTDDRGLSIGAAALVAARLHTPIFAPEAGMTAFLGPPKVWASELNPEFPVSYSGVEAIQQAAEVLRSGGVVAWFEGRDEAGPRALGHRSLLASPTRIEIRERLNDTIKQREAWRPFGCSLLKESVGDWFDCYSDSPYMLRIAQVHPNKRNQIPAVIHADGTSRLHTVTITRDSRLHALLSHLVTLDHPPILLNTSLNGRGEPIVHTPSETFDFAKRAGLDAVMIEDTLFTREALA